MRILDILNAVAATDSKLEKVAILKRNVNNETLKAVFLAAYNPFVNYYIKQIPHELREGNSGFLTSTLESGLADLSKLSSRQVTGDKAKSFLAIILDYQTADNATVIERIIQRDLRIGASESTANKVWPGLIPTFDVMLSHKDISGIKFPCYGQVKSDGARCHLYFDGVRAIATSRNGKNIELHGVLDNDISYLLHAGQTLDGELLCYRNGKVLSRQEGNGILNKAIKGTITPKETALIRFAAWDIVDFTSTVPYKSRISNLTEMWKLATYSDTFTNKIYVLETHIINNKNEAELFFGKCVADGEEGSILKNMNSMWVPKRTKDLGKMKSENTGDLKITGYVEGTGKYVGMLGAWYCETSDGLLAVSVGTGLSDADRKEMWDNKESYRGKIVEVKYNQIIQDKNGGPASLFLPRLLGIRFDKDIANSFKELK